MSRAIHCKTCGKYLGEIRDAILSKLLVTVCDSFHIPSGTLRGRNASTPVFMSDLFNGINK